MRRSWIVILLILLSAISSMALGYLLTESDKKPIILERMDDPGFIYDFYITATPDISQRPYYGQKDAYITMVAYLEFNSTSTRYFLEELFPLIESQYISTGKLRFYQKHHISIENYKNSEKNYIYSKYIQCHYQTTSPDYYRFYFNFSMPDNLSEEFWSCVDGKAPEELIQDISEVENFGMVGISPRIYIGIMGRDYTVIDGIPSYNRLRRILLDYQTQIGDLIDNDI